MRSINNVMHYFIPGCFMNLCLFINDGKQLDIKYQLRCLIIHEYLIIFLHLWFYLLTPIQTILKTWNFTVVKFNLSLTVKNKLQFD